jgi:ABC-type multidrug transport system fused ATPase/permease subunit
MESENFTTSESSRGTAGSARILLRYFSSVPFFRWALVPTIVLSLVTTLGHQFFIWLSGALAECSADDTCASRQWLKGFSLAPSFTLLGWLAVSLVLLRIVQWTLFETGGQLGSSGLFRKLVGGVGRVRTTFFDEYPSGKIINRLVRDSDSLRLYGPIRLGDSINALVELVVVAFVISYASKAAALVAIPTLVFFVYVQRNIAPMLQHIMVLRTARFGEVLHRESDVIEGVRTFVLYDELPSLMQRLTRAVFKFMQMHFVRGQIEAWGRFLCDASVALYGSLVLVAVYIGIHYDELSPVLGALVITASFRLGGIFSWLTWSFGQLYETAGHARRVFEYVDLPPEELQEGEKPRGPDDSDLTLDGDLVLSSYSMSYRSHTPIILSDLSVIIKRGSKVGLVGRTGAGKSSLVQALFRMVHVRGGDIRVGSRSLLLMPLAEARALFAVVPQDPYLFHGTIRANLDRLNEYSDEVLRGALARVGLERELDEPISEGGGNLSLGERQLLCLARVIVSKKPFVIMDEPTSGVDTITDAAIQQVLRAELFDRTIITIAHRLETLARQDRIIELEAGRVLRDGTPAEVLPLLTEEELG